MPKPVVTKPRSFPRGSGWGWDSERRQVTLRFRAGGKQRIVRGDTTTACLLKRKAMEEALEAEAEAAAELANGSATVSEMMEKWFEYHAGAKKPNTRRTYRRSMIIVGEHPLGQRLARQVTLGDIEDFYLWMVDVRNYGRGQLKLMKSHLNKAYFHGIRHEYCKINPTIGALFPGHVRPPGKATWLLEDQFTEMRRYLIEHPTPAHTALLVALLAGLRPCEILALRWEDIDAEIYVRRVLKTPSSERKIQLTTDLIAALQRLRQTQRIERMAAVRWHESDLVFTRDGGRAMTDGTLRYWLERVCHQLGMDYISPHKLRHTNGSMLLDRGASLADVADHLGHADLQMVTTTYTHKVKAYVPVAALLAEEA